MNYIDQYVVLIQIIINNKYYDTFINIMYSSIKLCLYLELNYYNHSLETELEQ